MYFALPAQIQNWLDANGGPLKMTVNDYWFLRDVDLWKMGYPRRSDVPWEEGRGGGEGGILTYDKRQAYWNWCREFIDREAIYRADDTGSACGCAPRLRGGWREWVR